MFVILFTANKTGGMCVCVCVCVRACVHVSHSKLAIAKWSLAVALLLKRVVGSSLVGYGEYTYVHNFIINTCTVMHVFICGVLYIQ